MDEKLQRITIAKTTGWTSKLVPPTPDGPENPYGEFQHTWWCNPQGKYTTLPDYLNDLNAMHEAEKSLFFKESLARKIFGGYLVSIVKGNLGQAYNPSKEDWINSQSATASQRAEAFLRTIGEWID